MIGTGHYLYAVKSTPSFEGNAFWNRESSTLSSLPEKLKDISPAKEEVDGGGRSCIPCFFPMTRKPGTAFFLSAVPGFTV